MSDCSPIERAVLVRSAVIALVGCSALLAFGRLRPAFALTLGAAVAIVSALWLSDIVGRLSAQRGSAAARLDWKFGLKVALRYAVTGALLFAAVRVAPAEVPWLLVGVSSVVLAVAVETGLELRRAARGGNGAA